MSSKFFYSSFFQKSSFLTSEKNFYSSKKYLNSQGFKNPNQFKNKVILEVGAGAGRVTLALKKLGYLNKIKRYYVLEPSDGIKSIKKKIRSKKFKYLNFTFQKLINVKQFYNKFDIILFTGVLPHIPLKLRDIFYESNKILKKNGELYLVSSYYSLEKKIDRYIKKKLTNLFSPKILSLIKSFFSIFLPYIFFRKNFIDSYSINLLQRNKQYLEFYEVEPYNIFYDYNYYIKNLNQNYFKIVEYFPYSIALKAKRTKKIKKQRIKFPATKNTIIFGDDWLTKWFIEKSKYKSFSNNKSLCSKYKNIIIAYDYKLKKISYYEIVRYFEKQGFKFSKNLFIFQMIK